MLAYGNLPRYKIYNSLGYHLCEFYSLLAEIPGVAQDIKSFFTHILTKLQFRKNLRYLGSAVTFLDTYSKGEKKMKVALTKSVE